MEIPLHHFNSAVKILWSAYRAKNSYPTRLGVPHISMGTVRNKMVFGSWGEESQITIAINAIGLAGGTIPYGVANLQLINQSLKGFKGNTLKLEAVGKNPVFGVRIGAEEGVETLDLDPRWLKPTIPEEEVASVNFSPNELYALLSFIWDARARRGAPYYNPRFAGVFVNEHSVFCTDTRRLYLEQVPQAFPTGERRISEDVVYALVECMKLYSINSVFTFKVGNVITLQKLTEDGVWIELVSSTGVETSNLLGRVWEDVSGPDQLQAVFSGPHLREVLKITRVRKSVTLDVTKSGVMSVAIGDESPHCCSIPVNSNSEFTICASSRYLKSALRSFQGEVHLSVKIQNGEYDSSPLLLNDPNSERACVVMPLGR